MKKIILIIIFFLISTKSFNQVLTIQQKLFYSCKVWGFIKYYHSNVSTCKINWDSVLLGVLPAVEAAVTDSEFNDALDIMLAAAGPMALSTTYFPDTLPADLKLNRDFSWIGAPVFRTDVQAQLDTIQDNFRPHAGCWVTGDPFEATRGLTAPWGGYLEFPPDTILLPVNTYTSFPDEDHRLLEIFKLWNIIRYFNPYNYVLDTSWDTTLYNYAAPIANASDPQSLFLLYTKIATSLNDVHVYGLTYSDYFGIGGGYQPFIRLEYIDSQYTVVNSSVTGVNIGDAIIAVDGMTTAQWEDSLKPYCSSGNISVFRRTMCQRILGRQNNGTIETLVVEDSTGTDHTLTVTCINAYAINPSFFDNYIYSADSLDTIKWTTMPCGVGYVNMGNLQETEVNAMYNDLQNKSAIIFDLRNYPNNTIWDIATLMYPSPISFAKLMYPDTTYPGTDYWYYDYLGYSGNPTPYSGTVIILMNEQTQSQAEFSCMVLGAMPGSVKIGSQTAGADGDVTWFKLSDDMNFGYTSLGAFYPNGDSTQRIGIVPDSVVYPTRAGIRHGDDEVLDKALTIAGCYLSTPNVTVNSPVVMVFPNPANDFINVLAKNMPGDKITIDLTDIAGKILIQTEADNSNQNLSASLNIATIPPGFYFVIVKTDMQEYVSKIITN